MRSFDYKDSQAAAEIRRYTNNNLKLVFDCISLDSTAKFCDDAISTTGGEYAALLPVSIDRANVKSRFVLGYVVIGEAFKIGDMAFPAKLEDQALVRSSSLLWNFYLPQGRSRFTLQRWVRKV